MKISIVGTGYVGLCTGVGFALKGNNVTCVDLDEKKIEMINKGKSPIYENGLEDAMKDVGDRLKATTDVSEIKDTDVTFVAVGTPSRDDGSIDLTYIEKAASDITSALSGKKDHVIVMKSTVVPGTTERVFSGWDGGLCMNPEFLREGRAMDDFLNPDRVVIGERNGSGDTLEELYKNFDAPVLRTDIKTAELIKYASNAMLATRVSFANEIGNMCKKLGVDVYDVMRGVGMDRRIGPKFLNAGAGFGGSCFPKDVAAIRAVAREMGVDHDLLESVLAVNEKQKTRIVDLLKDRVGELERKRVAVLGLAFKAGTDDVRDSVAIDIISALKEGNAEVAAYDPMAEENMRSVHPDVKYKETAKEALESADACLILTDWDEFKDLKEEDFSGMKEKVIIEGRRTLDRSKVKSFEGVCW